MGSLKDELAEIKDERNLWRAHWDIENGFYYPLDVISGEETLRLRVRSATLRRLVFQLGRSLPHLPSLKLSREHVARAPLSARALMEIGV